jgi:hypothetical protein
MSNGKGTTWQTGSVKDQAAFVVAAIPKLRNDGYKGIHSVFSGFNDAFRLYFAGHPKGNDPITWTNHLNTKGVIGLIPSRGGVMLYLPTETPGKAKRDSSAVLAKMGL